MRTYLGLTDEAYAKGGVEAAKVCGAPPLRTDTDRTALWDALRAGDIQTIGSDNTSWTVKQKAEGAADFRKIPYGVPGLETEMRVVYSEGVAKGRLSLQGFVSAVATTPAKLFGSIHAKARSRSVATPICWCSIPRPRRPSTSGRCTREPATIRSTASRCVVCHD
jgi:dihydropyrimidinase